MEKSAAEKIAKHLYYVIGFFTMGMIWNAMTIREETLTFLQQVGLSVIAVLGWPIVWGIQVNMWILE